MLRNIAHPTRRVLSFKNGTLRPIASIAPQHRAIHLSHSVLRSIVGPPSTISVSHLFRSMSQHAGESTLRPEPDKVLQDIADYVHNYQIDSKLAFETARLCLIDTIGCGLEALRFPECTKLLGPVVEGTVVPNGEFSTRRMYPVLQH